MNRQDLTLRNLHALKKLYKKLEARVKLLEKNSSRKKSR